MMHVVYRRSTRPDGRTGSTAEARDDAATRQEASPAAHPLLQLQRKAGNAAVCRMLADGSGTIRRRMLPLKTGMDVETKNFTAGQLRDMCQSGLFVSPDDVEQAIEDGEVYPDSTYKWDQQRPTFAVEVSPRVIAPRGGFQATILWALPSDFEWGAVVQHMTVLENGKKTADFFEAWRVNGGTWSRPVGVPGIDQYNVPGGRPPGTSYVIRGKAALYPYNLPKSWKNSGSKDANGQFSGTERPELWTEASGWVLERSLDIYVAPDGGHRIVLDGVEIVNTIAPINNNNNNDDEMDDAPVEDDTTAEDLKHALEGVNLLLQHMDGFSDKDIFSVLSHKDVLGDLAPKALGKRPYDRAKVRDLAQKLREKLMEKSN
jgi:hypothetical protein